MEGLFSIRSVRSASLSSQRSSTESRPLIRFRIVEALQSNASAKGAKSATCKERSPDSSFETNDCGCPRSSANSSWLSPFSRRNDLIASPSFIFCIIAACSNEGQYPKIGYYPPIAKILIDKSNHSHLKTSGVRTFSWTGHGASPRLLLYSTGLLQPRDLLMRVLL